MDGLNFPPMAEAFPAKKGGISLAFALLFAGLSLVLGLAMLLVPWQSPSMPYGACRSNLAMNFGCMAGLQPWLPFVLLGGGGVGIYAVIWRLRR